MKHIMTRQNNSTRVKAPNSNPEDSECCTTATTDDGASLNPNGRVAPDIRIGRNRLLQCKQLTNIGTFNVRTLRAPGKLDELSNNFTRCNLDVLGIIDHKIIHEDELCVKNFDRSVLITSSAWRNSRNAAVGGVGIMVSLKAESTLAEVKMHSPRILVAAFSGNPSVTIIVNYAPVEGDEHAEEHFQKLSNIVNSIPKHNLILEIGDFNAHVGQDLVKYSFHEKTNKNGNFLYQHIVESNMLITNTSFQKRSGKLWTYCSDMSGAKSQIDFILINHKWKNTVKNVEAYNALNCLSSDHRLVTARLKLTFRTKKSSPKKFHYEWSALQNCDIQEQFTIDVKNRLSALSEETDNVTTVYDSLVTSITESAEKNIPKKVKRKTIPRSKRPEVETVRDKVHQAVTAYHLNPSLENQEKINAEKNKLYEVYRQIEEEELQEKVSSIEESARVRDSQGCWKIINEITGRKVSKKGIIKGKTQKERLNKWFSHFHNLLGSETGDAQVSNDIPAVITEVNIYDGPFC